MDLGSNMGLGPRVLICQPAASPPQYTIDPLAYDILPITSAVLVIVTLLIYACIPKLHTLQGKCIIFYLIVLAIGCILTAHLAINDRRYGDYVTPNMCRLIGFILLISLLSSFLWLNVLNFNMWLSVYPTERFKHWTNTAKLQLYAVYGFGAPYIWTLIVYILDGFGSKLPLIFRPGSGEKSCFLNNMFLYFHFPCAITLIFNLILFVSIYISNRQYKVRQEQDLKLADENINRELLAGLSLVTGIILMIEIFAYLLIADSFEILLICIAVQGIIVFILFVLNCRVRSLIKERWQDYRAKRNSNRKNASNALMNEISSS